MSLAHDTDGIRLHLGDCLAVLADLPAASIETCITDPPYALTSGSGGGFMNKAWDSVLPGVDVWRAVFRVLKPGAMLLAFGGTRTWHRLACAIEDAGFELRDTLCWLYGSGFPKSHDISKSIDRAAGAEREVVGERKQRANNKAISAVWLNNSIEPMEFITAPATPAAREWAGYGTALKPSFEPIILAMKPLDGTFAHNALTHGVAGLNIDGCRIAGDVPSVPQPTGGTGAVYGFANGVGRSGEMSNPSPLGRWPANLLLDEHAAAQLDEQSGDRPGNSVANIYAREMNNDVYGKYAQRTMGGWGRFDSGGASRFFKVVNQTCPICGMEGVGQTWSESHVSSALESSSHTQATTADSARRSALVDTVSRLGQAAQSAGSLCVSCAIGFAQSIAATPRDRDRVSHLCLGFMPERRRQTVTGCLATFAALLGSTDIIPTMESLRMLYGSVRHAIDESTSSASHEQPGESDQTRFRYTSKASSDEREAFNNHPTVKPLDLMRYLVRLTRTPKGGTVLDPFLGSGTTAVACWLERRGCIGIERETEYLEIARKRLKLKRDRDEPLFSRGGK